jgi:hypothetical protein
MQHHHKMLDIIRERWHRTATTGQECHPDADTNTRCSTSLNPDQVYGNIPTTTIQKRQQIQPINLTRRQSTGDQGGWDKEYNDNPGRNPQ